MSFFGELRRRNVFKVGAAYAVVAWLLIQIAGTLLPTFGAPAWVVPVFSAVIILGFPVAVLLAWAFELTPSGVRPTAAVDPEQSLTSSTGQKLNVAIIALLVVAVTYMYVDNYLLHSTPDANGASGQANAADALTPAPPAGAEAPPVSTVGAAEAVADSARTAPVPNSVAVLPFDNLSPDEDNAYFAAGMYEEVLNQLAKLKNLRVISRTSMARYADSELSVPEIARELNVSAVMEGSVRYDSNNRVRITAQLIDAATDQHIWSDSYDRDLADVFAIQADIAMNIANALLVEFTPLEQQLIENVPTESPEAYALFLRAVEIDDYDQELAFLEDAVAIDPEFALAYARMASRYAFAVANSDGGSAIPLAQRNELEARARENAERALAIDPNLALAHVAQAQLAMLRWRWTEAAAAFERAREVQNVVIAHEVMLLSGLRRHDDAIALAERARRLNPDDPNAGWYGYALGWAGDYDAAADVMEQMVRRAPRYLVARDWLAILEIARGNPDAAITQLEFSERLSGPNPLMVFLPEWAYAYGLAGRRDDAERLFAAIERAVEAGGLPGAGGWAMAHLAIGDEAGALEWLETAAEKIANHEPDEGFFSLINLRQNHANDPVLERPEFVDVRNRLRGD